MSKFKFDGIEYEVPEKFTIGEQRRMEDKAHGFSEDKDLNALLAVLWIARYRVDKKARFEDFDELTVDQLNELVKAAEEEELEVADASPPALTVEEPGIRAVGE